MFYQAAVNEITHTKENVHALVVLTSAESKRLIAKAVAMLPEVQKALKEGTVIVSGGTGNAFVAEELLGIKIAKIRYTAGVICNGELGLTPPETRLKPYVLRKGQPVKILLEEALSEFGPGDVFIKGANAVDTEGNAGILVGNKEGGSIGMALPRLLPRGSHLIMPVGLEKLVPSVIKAAVSYDVSRIKYSTGTRPCLFPVVTGLVITEIQALEVLAGIKATHIASGGVGGSEGSVVLSLEGSEAQIETAFAKVKAIKGEPPVPRPD